ncbi:alpha-(1-2)-phosphatidylinositol mannosyltransferase, partial [Amycolatopsis thailandensis]
MKIGIVCPYSFDVPGGVQGHVIDLAKALLARGHEVSVLAPADEDSDVPDFVVPAGKALGIPYNGSVARLQFGPVSYARVRRWIRDGDFDVLHLHEPAAPSLSLLALKVADGPIVATFHTATTRSRTLAAFQPVLRPLLEKITARIAVSALARRVQVEHAGGDAVEVPNGVDVDFFSRALPLDGYPRAGGTVGFVGRYTEPRKGMGVLLEALRMLLPEFEELRLLVVGRGDADQLRREAGPALAPHIELLGQVDDETKARALRSVDVYCAPNTGGESFGMILTEAMAAESGRQSCR